MTNRQFDVIVENNSQDSFDDRNDEHADTREANFKCEYPDVEPGWGPGIDVMRVPI